MAATEAPADRGAPAVGVPVVIALGRRGLVRGGWGRLLGLLVATVVLLLVSVASVVVGLFDVGAADVVAAVSGTPQSDVERVVRYVRIPRTLSGILAGCALGVAGAVMQGLTRNPIAGPGLLGVNAGASLAVVLVLSFTTITTAGAFVWFAFVGAALAAVVVYSLGSLGLGGATPIRLALAGAAVTALISSITTGITLLDASTLDDLRFWLVGSLTRADSAALAAVAPLVALGLVLAVSTSRALNALSLGDDVARSLGTRLWRVRLVGALAVVLLAGGAVSIAGPIGFVGLAVPHVARMITGPDYRWVMAWTMVLAPILLLLADIVGRVLIAPAQLQVGIVTAFVGAPFFLYLVRHRRVIGL